MPDRNPAETNSVADWGAVAWGMGAGFCAALAGHIAMVGLYWLPIPVRFLGAVMMPAYDVVTILAVLAGGCVAGHKAQAHKIGHVFFVGLSAGLIESLPTILVALNSLRTGGGN